MTDVYLKPGRQPRLVDSPASRVRAEFEGFKLAEQAVEGASYRDLQGVAKELGIPANQSQADLEKAIADFEAEGAPANDRQTPETDNDGSPLDS